MTHNQSLKRYAMFAIVLVTLLVAPAAQAQTRLVVRDSLGLPGLNLTCLLLGCQVGPGLGIPRANSSSSPFPRSSIRSPRASARIAAGILWVEIDQTANTSGAYADSTPSYLTDKIQSPITALPYGMAM